MRACLCSVRRTDGLSTVVHYDFYQNHAQNTFVCLSVCFIVSARVQRARAGAHKSKGDNKTDRSVQKCQSKRLMLLLDLFRDTRKIQQNTSKISLSNVVLLFARCVSLFVQLVRARSNNLRLSVILYKSGVRPKNNTAAVCRQPPRKTTSENVSKRVCAPSSIELVVFERQAS